MLALPVGVEVDGGEGGLGEVAVGAVPLNVLLDEVDGVAATGEGAAERAVGGGMAVAPGGGEGEAVDDELHLLTSVGAVAIWAARSRQPGTGAQSAMVARDSVCNGSWLRRRAAHSAKARWAWAARWA